MDWLQYVIVALLIWFVISRMMPVKGLQNLGSPQVEELLKNPNEHQFVDVREINEYSRGHIQGFVNIPLSQLKSRIGELNSQRAVVLTCASGMRSRQAAKILRKHGFREIKHLRAGISGWSGRFVR